MYKFSLFLLAAVFICFPNVGHAYETTDQGARRLSNTTTLYSVSFSLGHERFDIYLPAETARNSTANDEIGYQLLAGSDTPSELGYMSGLVFGTVAAEDGFYTIPAGTEASFTLYALLEHNPISDDSEDDYALQVTNLPFSFDDERRQNGLNPSELQYYRTPEVDLTTIVGPIITLKGSR